MRIVLDTNVLVSAVISESGPPGLLLDEVRCGRCTLITSTVQLRELQDVLGRGRLRSRILPGEAEDLIRNLRSVAEVVTDLPDVGDSPDDADNLILAAAIAGRADVIVSGDKKHMLSLEDIEGIPIISARDAVDRLCAGGPR